MICCNACSRNSLKGGRAGALAKERDHCFAVIMAALPSFFFSPPFLTRCRPAPFLAMPGGCSLLCPRELPGRCTLATPREGGGLPRGEETQVCQRERGRRTEAVLTIRCADILPVLPIPLQPCEPCSAPRIHDLTARTSCQTRTARSSKFSRRMFLCSVTRSVMEYL